ncbi:MAG: VWA domain-containing protein [Spirochaetales bacterium]|nr:VWA domain-containing protein [Spirochaetales bacterium]
MIRFESPFYFALILVIPLLIYLQRRSRPALIYPSLKTLPFVKSIRIRLFFFRDLFFYLAVLTMITALAGPYTILGEEKDYSRGYMLQLVVDRSGSMGSFMDKKGESNRLDVVKSVLDDFINGNGSSLEGRGSDRIGLITFALYADTMAPLTVSHGIVTELLSTVSLAREEEDGTAIGDALALAVARLTAYQQKAGIDSSGSVIILLTDGQNNSGSVDPEEAAEMAARYGIKVYTIGFGGGYYRNAFGLIREIPPEYGIDEVTLQAIAETTGGAYFNAGDEKSLAAVYREIDRLEKVDTQELRSTEKKLYFEILLKLSLILLLAGGISRYLFLNLVEGEG